MRLHIYSKADERRQSTSGVVATCLVTSANVCPMHREPGSIAVATEPLEMFQRPVDGFPTKLSFKASYGISDHAFLSQLGC